MMASKNLFGDSVPHSYRSLEESLVSKAGRTPGSNEAVPSNERRPHSSSDTERTTTTADPWQFLHKWLAMSDEHECNLHYANGNLHIRFMDTAGGAMIGCNIAITQRDMRVPEYFMQALKHAFAEMHRFKMEQHNGRGR